MSWRCTPRAAWLPLWAVRSAALLLFLGGSLAARSAADELAVPSPLTPKFLDNSLRLHVAFAPGGRILALYGAFLCNDAPAGLMLCDLESDCKKVIIQKDLMWVRALAFSPDGKLFATGHDQGAVRLWETSSCKKLADLGDHGPKSMVYAAAVSPDGKLLATAGDDRIILWDIPKRKKRATLSVHSDCFLACVVAVAFAPDGKTLASASEDNTIRLTDVATGKLVAIVRNGDKDRFLAVAFSPDGRSLASGGEKEMQLWETATRKRRAVFDRYEGEIYCVTFSPDGRLLAGGSLNGEVKVWDLHTGKERFSQKCDTRVTSLSFSPDGRILAGSLGSEQVKLWDVSGLLHEGLLPPFHLSSAGLEALWADLAGEDAAKAYRAIQTLTRAGKQPETFLGDRLKPASPADPECIARLIKELDSDSFTVREKAEAELHKLEGLAEPALRQALQGKPSPEVRRRLESLLQKLDGPVSVPETLRGLRTVEILEYLGTPEARRILERLAGGATEARLTREAKASLERLTKRTAAAP